MKVRFAALVAVALVVAVFLVARTGREPQPPRFIEFDASADHDRQMPDGRPMLERYFVDLIPVDGTAPARTMDLGRPQPVDGRIKLEIPADLPPGEYEVRVSAQGPGGRSASSDVVRLTIPGR